MIFSESNAESEKHHRDAGSDKPVRFQLKTQLKYLQYKTRGGRPKLSPDKSRCGNGPN
jgi:hypothetical protein